MGNEKHKFGWVWKGGVVGRTATHIRQVIKTYMELLKEPPLPKSSFFIQPFLPSDATQTTPPLSVSLCILIFQTPTKMATKGQRNRSVFKSTCLLANSHSCSSGRPGFNYQHPHCEENSDGLF